LPLAEEENVRYNLLDCFLPGVWYQEGFRSLIASGRRTLYTMSGKEVMVTEDNDGNVNIYY